MPIKPIQKENKNTKNKDLAHMSNFQCIPNSLRLYLSVIKCCLHFLKLKWRLQCRYPKATTQTLFSNTTTWAFFGNDTICLASQTVTPNICYFHILLKNVAAIHVTTNLRHESHLHCPNSGFCSMMIVLVQQQCRRQFELVIVLIFHSHFSHLCVQRAYIFF